jgi:ferrous iron transport protein A
MLPLDLLATGEWAEVVEVHGEADWIKRMGEMGVHGGSRLQMIRSGSPCLLRVGNTRLCLRGDLATQILVRPVLEAGYTQRGQA